ncbi:MAG: glycerate kinase [Thermoproteota archaeon]|nr:glycerate kinase [Candidatus Brockarchaeota archaeon]MBO3767874.1 glycerate kinase [Candidatus Brockarchaeota archaeon]MBO3801931.1 glycerate kinase [Candidatus Brockarchaeota archaeon]
MKIVNKEELSKSSQRRDALEILEEGLKAADPKSSVKEALNNLRDEINRARRIFIIGFGKASVSMAESCEEELKDKIHDGAVITPRGVKEKNLRKIKVFEGTHPIPSEINVDSTKKLISICSNLTSDDLVICLISGGGSSLFTFPADGISLEEKKLATDVLLKSGADIKEINAIRKHISKVKGGQLLNFLKPAKVISLILSDVVGDSVEYIASGPTSPDSSTFKDAYNVIKKYNLMSKLPKSVVERIEKGLRGEITETLKPENKIFNNVKNVVVSNNMKSLVSMKNRAISLGYNSMILTSYAQGESREVGKFLCAIMKQISSYDTPIKKPACLILGGETTVTVKGKGKGGRNQELVLSVVLNSKGIKNFVFASVGSDGIDGCTDAAGAIADNFLLEEAAKINLEPEEFLENNDSYNFFKQTGNLIFTGPTGTNVNDFTIAIIF